MSLKMFEKTYLEFTKLLYSGKFYSDRDIEDAFDLQEMEIFITWCKNKDKSQGMISLWEAFSQLKKKADHAVDVDCAAMMINHRKADGEVIADEEYSNLTQCILQVMAELNLEYSKFQSHVKQQYQTHCLNETDKNNPILNKCLSTLNIEINPPHHGTEELNHLRQLLNNALRKNRENSPKGGSPVPVDILGHCNYKLVV